MCYFKLICRGWSGTCGPTHTVLSTPVRCQLLSPNRSLPLWGSSWGWMEAWKVVHTLLIWCHNLEGWLLSVLMFIVNIFSSKEIHVGFCAYPKLSCYVTKEHYITVRQLYTSNSFMYKYTHANSLYSLVRTRFYATVIYSLTISRNLISAFHIEII